MAKQLSLDEMLEVLLQCDQPRGEQYLTLVETLGCMLAADVAKALRVTAGPATFQGTAFAGTCAPFFPAFEGQSVPALLATYDVDGEWEIDPDPTPLQE